MQVNVSFYSASHVHDEWICDGRGAVFKGCGQRDEEAVSGILENEDRTLTRLQISGSSGRQELG